MRPVCRPRCRRRRVSPSRLSSALFGADDLVLRILELQAVRGQLQLAVQDDTLMGMEDVGEERLVEPDRAGIASSIRTSISKILKRGRRVGPGRRS